jgi:hypothetical protein
VGVWMSLVGCGRALCQSSKGRGRGEQLSISSHRDVELVMLLLYTVGLHYPVLRLAGEAADNRAGLVE